MKSILLCLCLCWLVGHQSLAQVEKTNPKWAAAIGSSLSWSGIDLSVRFVWCESRQNVFYIGPRLLLTNSYLPLEGPWGLVVGYRRNVLHSKRLTSFVQADYKAVFSAPYDPANLGGDFLNSIHEWHVSYGLEYSLGRHWSVGSTFGGGFYLERLTDLLEQKQNSFTGYSSQIQLFVHYFFGK